MEKKATAGKRGLATAQRAAVTLSTGVLITLCQQWAEAALIEPFNARPVPVAVISTDGAHTDVQSVLDRQFPLSGMNSVADQQSAGMWQAATSASPFVFPVLNFEYAGDAGRNVFGIWSGTETSAIAEVDIFRGRARSGGWATLTWNHVGDLVVQGTEFSVFNGIHSGIDPNRFGFYLRDKHGTAHYTVDQLNPGGVAAALAYNLSGSPLWMLAFDDGGSAGDDTNDANGDDGLSDNDFNDMIVTMAGISPVLEIAAVPLPAAGWQLAAGVAGLFGFAAQRRFGEEKHA